MEPPVGLEPTTGRLQLQNGLKYKPLSAALPLSHGGIFSKQLIYK